MNWHVESLKEIEERVRTDGNAGLDDEEAERRLNSFGGNIIAEQPHKTFWQRVGVQLKAFLVVILLSSALISLVVEVNSPDGNWLEPMIITALTVASAIACAAVEQSAEDARVRLLSISEAECRVLRNGKVRTVETAMLVPGDIVLLEHGDIVPADGRLLDCSDMRCDERPVGGEELSSLKDASAEPDVTVPIPGRANMVYAGCSVISGGGRMIVTETGADTEIGKQSTLLEYVDERNTPVKRQIAAMNKNLALAGLIIALFIFVAAYMSRHLNNMRAITVFVSAAALAVVIIPECVPLIAASIRMRCAAAMADRGVLVKNADVLETLGCVSVICTDKGSMVEKKRMSMRQIWTPDGRLFAPGKRSPTDSELRLLEYAVLCSDAEAKHNAVSSPGNSAIISCLRGYGVKKRYLDAKYPRMATYPFDARKRIMVTVHRVEDSYVAIAKGAPERILSMCGEYREGSENIERVRLMCGAMGEKSLQVLAVACIGLDGMPEDQSWLDGESGFALMGLLGLENRPAHDAMLTAAECHRAGIRVVMLTGDQAATARTVASETGILRTGEELLTSAELAKMSDKELENNLRKYSVFASMSTEDKLRIVRAWQQSRETIAATGASADDVVILRQADIGCSMGVRDTDTVKGIADVTVADDSLSAVYAAVREGRRVFRSLRTAVQYVITCSLALSVLFVAVTLLTGTIPLRPAQLLLLFPLVMLLPAVSFADEPADEALMRLPPRHPSGRFFSARFILDTALYGVGIAILTIIAFFTGMSSDIESARTMAYAVAALSMLSHSLSVRTSASVFNPQFYANRDYLLTFFISVSVTLMLLFVPWKGFYLYPLTFGQWTAVATLALVPLAGGELLKVLRRMSGGHIITGIEDI